MGLMEKYRELITAARAAKVSDLQVNEQDGMLHIDGIACSAETKHRLKYLYERIDTDGSGDVIMNISIPQNNGRNN